MMEAREVMDRCVAARAARDLEAVADCYTEDAHMLTPDEGDLVGRDRIMEYFKITIDAFPDLRSEYVRKHESGNAAIDEYFAVGRNTEPLPTPSGQTVAPGRQLRLRVCEVAIVENGRIVRSDLYFDQLEFLQQLDLLPGMSA
jgi:ketosteroid isomerase-like protein